ncbi:MAG: hypothetical protein EB140_03320 [Proteobacteria bacterium]|nr:hypothetical protein [Pseudomonadota bacterium]
MVMSLDTGDAGVFVPAPGARRGVAALCTVYRPRSHADVIVSKLLGDYSWPHVYDRDALAQGQAIDGPAIIEERETTVVLPPQWRAIVEPGGCIVAQRNFGGA